MRLRTATGVFVLGLLAAGGATVHSSTAGDWAWHLAGLKPASGDTAHPPSTLSGAYLSSHYAQSRSDWTHATALLERILQSDPNNQELLRQSMILAKGSGDHAQAAARARALLDMGSKDSMAHMIVATDAIRREQYEKATQILAQVPRDDMSDFVLPLLNGWAQAGLGRFAPETMKQSTIHAYHGGMIAHFLKKKEDVIFGFAEAILAPSGLTAEEVERAADLMAIAGRGKDAVNLYKALLAQRGRTELLMKKITAVENKQDLEPVIPALAVKTPAQGAAIAILDLARILYQEKSESSARVFAQMALDLDPSQIDARLLIASSYARSGRVDEAIRQFNGIPHNHPSYLSSQHKAAELLSDSGRIDEAVAHLNALYDAHKNPDSLIRVGDLYRTQEDFAKALEIYNRVAATLPSPVPPEYWHFLYARGMTQERLGNWSEAEADLKLALSHQPDHPHIMNYLAYAWADQGIHLDEALQMLLKASSLRPQDGYITDSLGWAYYRMGRYDSAIPHLERAVELLPYDPEVNDHLGDAYWRVGRKVEARFQWERAKNHATDPAIAPAIAAKIENGLDDSSPRRAARSE